MYLGWEGLNSSQLKAYNVYYGTTSGKYIQRRSIDNSTTTHPDFPGTNYVLGTVTEPVTDIAQPLQPLIHVKQSRLLLHPDPPLTTRAE